MVKGKEMLVIEKEKELHSFLLHTIPATPALREREMEGGHMMANEREGAIITLTFYLSLPTFISSF